MGIWEIDGIRQDRKGRKSEEEFDLLVCARKIKKIGVQIDVEITPLYCMNCNKQLEGFYKHDGSRYGQVGSVQCNHCDEEIRCVDHDNIVEELITYSGNQKLVLDYYKLYKLENEVWNKIKEKTGYDLFQRYSNEEWVPLHNVMDEICTLCNVRLVEIPPYTYNTSDKIKKFPYIANKWFALLHYLEIDI
ncbi:hypothetical protein [Acetivibrio saccincola]|uniref:Uncharacterized protein n=1 Tax=Acetivibrio saccincola TaxID=1677857 RepID=A0A2S8R9B8_9FIRM|nr:hypothetical protein [Acetivibrio saccincola]PQQ66380.1 hypothetical protein B9R14_06200 [Acetivibrio saccincola]